MGVLNVGFNILRSRPNLSRRYVGLVASFCRMCGVRVLRSQLGGHALYISTEDPWGLWRYYFRTKFSRPEVARLRCLLQRQPAVFWDVGANYGIFTLQLFPFASQTIALEPVSRTFECLKQSCALASQRIVVEQCAVGSGDGEIAMHMPKRFSGDSRAYEPAGSRHPLSERVNCKTLDSLAQEFGIQDSGCHVMKIDVQGFEVEVLKGADGILKHAESIHLFLEVWPKGLEEAGTSVQELTELCKQHNLQPLDEACKTVSWGHVTGILDGLAPGKGTDLLVGR